MAINTNTPPQSIKMLSVIDAQTLLASGQADNYLLVDVREPHERAADHIGGLHIPMSRFSTEELPHDKALIIYCQGGVRSYRVAEYLILSGFDDVSNLTGGMKAWREQFPKN